MLRAALLIFCLFLIRPVVATPTLVLDDSTAYAWLYPYLEVAEDPDNRPAQQAMTALQGKFRAAGMTTRKLATHKIPGGRVSK